LHLTFFLLFCGLGKFTVKQFFFSFLDTFFLGGTIKLEDGDEERVLSID
jgi:hypothetical protein